MNSGTDNKTVIENEIFSDESPQRQRSAPRPMSPSPCFILAAIPVLAGGIPFGIYLTVFGLLILLLLLVIRIGTHQPLDRLEKVQFYLLAATMIAACWISNGLILFLIYLTLCCALLYNLAIISGVPKTTFSELRLCSFALASIGRALRDLCDPITWSYLTPKNSPAWLRQPTPQTLKSVIILLLVLAVFHLLLATVNSDYAYFISNLFDTLIYIVEQVISWEFIAELIWWLILSALMFSILNPPGHRPGGGPSEEQQKLKGDLIIGGSATLLAIFSWFQTNTALIESVAKSFGQFSRYTQAGFWELLTVAALGYILLRFLLWARPEQPKKPEQPMQDRNWRILVLIFLGELSLLTIFSAHKLLLLQSYFGLKDQRILASVALVLILLTTLGTIWKVLNHKVTISLLPLQSAALVFSVTILTVGNFELFATRTHPISYTIDGKSYPDLAYLLNNSNDNWRAWLDLVNKANSQGTIPYPSDYYWGDYQPICRPLHRYQPGIWEMEFGVPFEDQVAALQRLQTYREQGELGRWRRLVLNTPINTLRAARLVSEQKDLFNQFVTFVRTTCQTPR